MLLGCIADDFTGATDLANNLVRGGMRTIQTIGTPEAPLDDDVDAAVVALKSRTLPAAEAVAQSLAALKWLQSSGCRQFYFKYCSTFDSTPAGNIGPVTEALLDALGADFTIACPAFPENKRTVFKGYLFAGDVLLNESGMQHHPLTPMKDANLVRVLQAQTRRTVGLVPYDIVARGEESIRERFAELRKGGVAMAVVDAISDADLMSIGRAVRDLPLVTAGSGVAIGLPQNFVAQGLLQTQGSASRLPAIAGHRAIVSGSCSVMTNRQVAHFIKRGGDAYALDALQLAAGGGEVERVIQWAAARLQRAPVLVYSTAEPARVKEIQARLGVAGGSALIEQALSDIARGLVAAGVKQLVVAGGETSGAVVGALGIRALRIGPQIDPGVPWTCTLGDAPMLLALKSGNFGAEDFFTRAFDLVHAPASS
ncbi:MAG TPA: 3-oxo-tetronate kinase [Burkholderiales bacterium]|nr:3-oxo-tetronate kinase [Burkholderiales bacterium]